MHGTTMVFLFGMPILIGLANYMVPLMIGARDMAFPRLNAFSYWIYLFGGLLLYSSFIFGGALDTGWFSYAPLTEGILAAQRRHFWIVSLVLLGGSSMVGPVNFIATMPPLARPRHASAADADLRHGPTFINSFLILFAIPSLTAGAGDALPRPPLRHVTSSTLPAAATPDLAAPLLVLRPPRGLHPHPAGLRHDVARWCRCSRASRSSAAAR